MIEIQPDWTDALLHELVSQVDCLYISDLRLFEKEVAMRLIKQNKKRYVERYGKDAFEKVIDYIMDNPAVAET